MKLFYRLGCFKGTLWKEVFIYQNNMLIAIDRKKLWAIWIGDVIKDRGTYSIITIAFKRR